MNKSMRSTVVLLASCLAAACSSASETSAPAQLPTEAPASPAPAPAKDPSQVVLAAKLVGSIPASATTRETAKIVRWDIRQGQNGHWVTGMGEDGAVRSTTYVRIHNALRGKVATLIFEHEGKMVVDPKTGEAIRKDGLEKYVANAQLLGSDVAQSDLPYGCIGDIAWAVGGLVAAAGACSGSAVAATYTMGALAVPGWAVCSGAVLGGPVAGTISAIEDCSPTPTCAQYGSCTSLCGGSAGQAAYPDCTCYCNNAWGGGGGYYGGGGGWSFGGGDGFYGAWSDWEYDIGN